MIQPKQFECPNWQPFGFNGPAPPIQAVGDHFGGLPFLLLQAEFVARRTKPLEIAGPPGLKSRLDDLCEAMFPGMTRNKWRFPLVLKEVTPGEAAIVGGFGLSTVEVIHPSGAPATGLRLSDGGRTFAYSGDTAWTDALYRVADGADLMMVECYAPAAGVPYHIDWPTLAQKLPQFGAKRILLTHLGDGALAIANRIRQAGYEIAEDGRTYDL